MAISVGLHGSNGSIASGGTLLPPVFRLAAPVVKFLPRRGSDPVLVVEDDESIQRLLCLALTKLGYKVDSVGSFPEACTRIRRQTYSLVLADHGIQGGTGLELLEHCHRVHPDLPFIILTGHDDADLARAFIERGALDFLAKPFDLRQLARVLEQNQARLDRDRHRFDQLTREVLSGTLRALVAAVDAKDPYTRHHSERVARLAGELGQALRLPPDRQRVLEFAALLHDVGKIAVPERILLKPGPLDTEEWEIIKLHPVWGADIVGQVEALAEVAGIIRHHHERLDGLGYPDGLEGDAIPPLARILTVADTFEALTTRRAYREPFTPESARETIRQNLGTQFDREIGELFLSLPGCRAPRSDRT